MRPILHADSKECHMSLGLLLQVWKCCKKEGPGLLYKNCSTRACCPTSIGRNRSQILSKNRQRRHLIALHNLDLCYYYGEDVEKNEPIGEMLVRNSITRSVVQQKETIELWQLAAAKVIPRRNVDLAHVTKGIWPRYPTRGQDVINLIVK